MKTVFLLTSILCSFFLFNVKAYNYINNEGEIVHFEYPGPAISERDLPICPPYAVCSVLHKRFWAPQIAKRLCRCLKRLECPWQWSIVPDNNTMQLDNRSQLKFCDEVTNLRECNAKKTALTVATTNTHIYENQVQDDSGTTIASTPITEEERKQAVNASCLCPPSHTWREQPQKQEVQSSENTSTTITYYRCKPMQKCVTMEFCGYMRADYFSIYYRCSCPEGHLCLNQNRTAVFTSELLYEGSAYKAFCLPKS